MTYSLCKQWTVGLGSLSSDPLGLAWVCGLGRLVRGSRWLHVIRCDANCLPPPSLDHRDHRDTPRSVCCAHSSDSTTRAGRDREYVESQHFSFLLDSDNPVSPGIATLVFCSNLTSGLAWRRHPGYSVLGHAPRPQFARLIRTVDRECTQQC